ncbi:MAG: oligosaccharide flippase family protein [Blautia sp.]|nr:oligosaccharide flippase family protein [Blautia sp.]
MRKNENTLVKNASYLMVAALVSKIIGMLYKSPLSTILGNNSYALFQYAQNVYFLLLMISSFSIPQAVSKVISEKLTLRRYRDAQKVFHCALLYAVIAGGLVSLVCVFGASLLVPDSMANARLALQMLAPTIFLSGILGVYRGYFQAHRNMVPTSLSQIIEQIMVAIVALVMANYMINRYANEGEEVMRRMGAAGATMGTGAGVLAALLFMVFIYALNRGTIHAMVARDHRSLDESTGLVMQELLMIIMPIVLGACVYNVDGFINSYMYSGISGAKGLGSGTIELLYAEYGYYGTLINIPLTLAGTAPMSMIPEVAAHYVKKDMKGTHAKIDRTTWISMLISIPSAAGLAVLAGPITRLIFPGTNGVSSQLLLLGAITIILNGNSNISNGVLQGIGKPRIPLYHSLIALGVDVVVAALLLTFTDLGVYTIVIAIIAYSVIMCLLNDFSMKKYLGYKNPWKYAYLSPLLASVPMALTAGGIYYLLYFLTHRNFISLVPALILAILVYFVFYLMIANPSDEDFDLMPGGSYARRLAHMLPVIRVREKDRDNTDEPEAETEDQPTGYPSGQAGRNESRSMSLEDFADHYVQSIMKQEEKGVRPAVKPVVNPAVVHHETTGKNMPSFLTNVKAPYISNPESQAAEGNSRQPSPSAAKEEPVPPSSAALKEEPVPPSSAAPREESVQPSPDTQKEESAQPAQEAAEGKSDQQAVPPQKTDMPDKNETSK